MQPRGIPCRRPIFIRFRICREDSAVIVFLIFCQHHIISRKYRFPIEEVKESLSRIATFTEIAGLTEDVVKWALSCDWNDYEDATQYQSALLVNADCIVTRNKKDYSKSTVPVYSVAELKEIS